MIANHFHHLYKIAIYTIFNLLSCSLDEGHFVHRAEEEQTIEKQHFTSHPKCRESLQHLFHPLPSKRRRKKIRLFPDDPRANQLSSSLAHLYAYFISSLVQTHNYKSQRQTQLAVHL